AERRCAAGAGEEEVGVPVAVRVERPHTPACGVLDAAAVDVADPGPRRFFDVPRGAEGHRRAPAGGEGASHIGHEPEADDRKKSNADDERAPGIHGADGRAKERASRSDHSNLLSPGGTVTSAPRSALAP